MNPKHQGLILLLILSSFFNTMSASAQNKQSEPENLTPEQQLETLPHDTSRIRPLFIIANSYLYSDSAKTLRYLKEGLELSRKFDRQKAVCNFLLLWTELYNTQGKWDKAVAILDEAQALAIRIRNTNFIATCEQLRGVICNEQGDYPCAIAHDIEYMHQGQLAKDTQMILVGLVNISVAYQNEKNDEKTIEYARKILQYPYSPRNVLPTAKALEMIASVYISQHKYAQAEDTLKKALNLYIDEKVDNGIAMIYTTLAECYPDDPYHILKYSLPAQTLWDKLAPDNGYAIANLGNIGAAYTHLAREKMGLTRASTLPSAPDNQDTAASRALSEAIKLTAEDLKARANAYYTKALERANRVSDRLGILQVSDSLASLEALDGRYKDAYSHLKQHQILYDSVFSQDNKNHVAGIEADYKVELSNQQLKINQLELSNQIKIKWLLISSLSLTLLVLALIYWQSRLRKKANQQLNEANRVKTQFFAILNHDLRRPVASLITLLNLHQHEPDLLDQETMKTRTGQLTFAAENLLETMEDLLIWSKGQMEKFRPNMKPVAVATLFADIEKKFTSDSIALSFDQPPGLSIQTDRDFAQTILRNLTGNATKALEKHFAATGTGNTPGQGKITWKAWQQTDATYLSITDNGPGATADQLNPLFDEDAVVGIHNGLGLHIIRDMAKAIGCEIQTITPPIGGLEIRLRWPGATFFQ